MIKDVMFINYHSKVLFEVLLVLSNNLPSMVDITKWPLASVWTCTAKPFQGSVSFHGDSAIDYDQMLK